jgi:ATP-dependent protease HslVU (ClpYQ) peptidase subunit
LCSDQGQVLAALELCFDARPDASLPAVTAFLADERTECIDIEISANLFVESPQEYLVIESVGVVRTPREGILAIVSRSASADRDMVRVRSVFGSERTRCVQGTDEER